MIFMVHTQICVFYPSYASSSKAEWNLTRGNRLMLFYAYNNLLQIHTWSYTFSIFCLQLSSDSAEQTKKTTSPYHDPVHNFSFCGLK